MATAFLETLAPTLASGDIPYTVSPVDVAGGLVTALGTYRAQTS